MTDTMRARLDGGVKALAGYCRKDPNDIYVGRGDHGDAYLNNILKAGATETKTFREMNRMLEHYATTDVVPLFELADSQPFSEYM